MPVFNLRCANRSQSAQDWAIFNGPSFTLQPDFVNSGNVNMTNTYTFRIAVNTNNSFGHADLTYTAGTNVWTLASLTPNEWELAQGNGIVTVRCLLENVNEDDAPSYTAGVPVLDDEAGVGNVSYPAYQLYKDEDRTTYCSSRKVGNHEEGNQWIKLCLAAHPGTRVQGPPWTSEDQKGVIWPD
ncbi:hypothetical protein SAMN05428988_0763 [Chitinophaga sp. YR573]|uniref:hypothetical protein n=1 Tax=Chitinophaga sp. YR573 TaxID=1881040 RepID=UPI0008C482B6|nr:hypothetical protein [Chitinophaga sp. YR573]SEV95490.1 hypothetical protein SAMN05428988_0763 [Chitinophaga sp. YR573]